MLVIECVILCALFTVPVYLMSRDPIRTLYNYPPNIRARVQSLEEYRGRIPTRRDKRAAKLAACGLFVLLLSLILRYVNGCRTFWQAFGQGFLLWTVVNLYDALVLDIAWFCHDPRFVLPGTEDMTADYHDYGFHIRGFFIGEAIALAVCAIAGLVVRFLL